MNGLVVGLAIANRALREEVCSCLLDLHASVPIDEPGIGDPQAFLHRVNLERPDVLIVELSGPADRTEELLGALKSSAASPAVIALDAAARPDAIIAAMRAGVVDYLYPPLHDRLGAVLQRIWTERAAQGPVPRSGKALAFVSAKGGCGATTIACHLALEFQRQTVLRTLLADFDMDAGMVRFILKTKSSYSLLDAVTNVDRLDASFWKALVSNGRPRLEIIAAPAVAAAVPADEGPFRRVLRFARGQYDYVLADLGRGLSPRSLSLLQDMDECYVVTTLDIPALYQAKQVLRALEDAGYGRERLRLIVNRMPKRPDVTIEDIGRMVGTPVYGIVPDDHEALHEAYAGGRLAEPGSFLGAHFAWLAANIAGLPVERPAAKRKFAFF